MIVVPHSVLRDVELFRQALNLHLQRFIHLEQAGVNPDLLGRTLTE